MTTPAPGWDGRSRGNARPVLREGRPRLAGATRCRDSHAREKHGAIARAGRLVERAAALPPPHAFAQPQEFRGADGRVVAAVSTLQDAVEQLRRLGRPFLDWTGKAERLSFDVPSLPLFVHERLSTKTIVETLTGHRRERQQTMFELFGDPQHPVTDQVLRAYEHQDQWVNRLVLGDSLVVMNSLLRYEGLGGQVQMIYMEDQEELYREATVWIDGLDRIHKLRGINFCVDLSATPYYLGRMGADTNRIFPWVVSEFGLTDAIESGLVKTMAG